jgi:hypothetical protein
MSKKSLMKGKTADLKFKIMKNSRLKLTTAFIIVFAASCNGPETVVTNIIHADGSVTRKVEMKNHENKFSISNIQVPVDSTWNIRDSVEISEKGDTTWVRRAEKLFRSTDEINLAYHSDSSVNKGVTRRAEFRKKFKWFNTEYRYSEIIDRNLKHGYPVDDFLNKDELRWFYSPENVKSEKKNGPDSLRYRALSDAIDKKNEKWTIKSLASEWIYEFTALAEKKGMGAILEDSLKKHEDEFMKTIEESNEKFDSLWKNGNIIKMLIGENDARKYRTEADSALETVTNRYLVDFKEYTVRAVMPGKLTATNGIVDSSGMLLWPVRSDYFLTRTYEMWAESKNPNSWAWVISGLFLVFVFTGIILKRKGKG